MLAKREKGRVGVDIDNEVVERGARVGKRAGDVDCQRGRGWEKAVEKGSTWCRRGVVVDGSRAEEVGERSKGGFGGHSEEW